MAGLQQDGGLLARIVCIAIFFKKTPEDTLLISSEKIGTKVKINRKTEDKGKIEIEYYSPEELEKILDLMF